MIKIPVSIKQKMVSHCLSQLPNEACGILAGQDNTVTHIYLMENIEKSPESFLMDPKEQLQVFKDIRAKNLKMIAIFHSHPYTPARPSEKDIKMAFYPDIYYIIISFEKIPPSMKAFEIKDSNVKEVEILEV